VSVPSADRVVAALQKHPDLYADVARVIEELEHSEPPIYEYKEVRTFPQAQKYAEDGWRMVGMIPDSTYKVIVFLERRRKR